MSEKLITLRNGVWNLSNSTLALPQISEAIFDQTIDKLVDAFETVFTEPNPIFELSPDKRFAANIYGKSPKYSGQLMDGLATNYAMLGTNPETFPNCTDGYIENQIDGSVRRIFEDADWIRWASMDNFLTCLAEAAPNVFLAAVKSSLANKEDPFGELFSQESNGIAGRNYLSGLFRALETLAWNNDLFVETLLVLAKLDTKDPGGNWTNRPSNSLIAILLPWFPQTSTTIELRVAAVKIINKEFPEQGWRLLVGLLPSSHQISSGATKPRFRDWVPADWKDGNVSRDDYWKQIDAYGNYALEIAKEDLDKLVELIPHFPKLTKNVREEFIAFLESKQVTELEAASRFQIWSAFTKLIQSHRLHSDADWSFDAETIERLSTTADGIKPMDLINLHRRLFQKDDYSLYEEAGDWQKQRKIVDNKRLAAAQEIYESLGLAGILELNKNSESNWDAGYAFARALGGVEDSELLPNVLEIETNATLEFLQGYVSGRFEAHSWPWVDELSLETWSTNQVAAFFRMLPFNNETWSRVSKFLGKHEDEYWKKKWFNAFQAKKDELDYAIRQLLRFDRPKAALECIRAKILDSEEPFDPEIVVKALLESVASDEPHARNDRHSWGKIIERLQNTGGVDKTQLLKVEWAYLKILDEFHAAEPKTLERELATNPQFFCDVIAQMYMSRKQKKTNKPLSDQQTTIAENSYQLLNNWKVVPGTTAEGDFSPDIFNSWISQVESICEESGHLEVAQSHIGKVLNHSPPDEGLWINKVIAECLNREEAGEMRSGYRIGIFNSRGVHFVDPSGKSEFDLATKYRKQANEVEAKQFFRIATELRMLADTYERQGKSIAKEHNSEEQ